MSEVTVKIGELPSSWKLTSLGAVFDYGRTAKTEPSELAGDDWILELEDIERDSSPAATKRDFFAAPVQKHNEWSRCGLRKRRPVADTQRT